MNIISKIQYSNFKFYSIILLFFLFYFSRLAVYLGLPNFTVHLHYIFILIFFCFLLKDIIQYKSNLNLLFYIYLLVISFSSFFNSVNFLNFFTYTLILLEPLILCLIFYVIRIEVVDIKKIEKLLIYIAIINTIVSYIQYFILGLKQDDTHGIFINLGAAAHVSGFFSSIVAIHLLTKNLRITIKNFFIALFLISTILLGDAKQVIFGYLISIFIIIIMYNFKLNFFNKIKNLILILILVTLLIFVIKYTDLVRYFIPTMTIEIFLEGISEKLKVFNIINQYHSSLINFFLGLGPGHSTSRLASMIPYYGNFNFSSSILTDYVLFIQNMNYLTRVPTGSSIFSLYFFWGGIYGDIGFFGLICYLIFLLFLVNQNNLDKISIFIIINIFSFGLIFNWPEEPAFIFTITILLYIRFNLIHEQK